MRINTKIVGSTDLTVSVAIYINQNHTGDLQVDRVSYSKLIELLGAVHSSTEDVTAPSRQSLTPGAVPKRFVGNKSELATALATTE